MDVPYHEVVIAEKLLFYSIRFCMPNDKWSCPSWLRLLCTTYKVYTTHGMQWYIREIYAYKQAHGGSTPDIALK